MFWKTLLWKFHKFFQKISTGQQHPAFLVIKSYLLLDTLKGICSVSVESLRHPRPSFLPSISNRCWEPFLQVDTNLWEEAGEYILNLLVSLKKTRKKPPENQFTFE